jgi:hypothetical protein
VHRTLFAANVLQPPKFAAVAEERLHRKRMLAVAFRLFSRFGFDEGVAGHITARDPERLDHSWVNPFGMHFGQICASDLILVNHHGQVVEGKYPVNGAAFCDSLASAPHALTWLRLRTRIRCTGNLGDTPAAARSHQARRLRVLRGSWIVRGFYRRGVRCVRGRADRQSAWSTQVRDAAE